MGNTLWRWTKKAALALLVGCTLVALGASAARAEEPRRIEGVPCEVCVSEASVSRWKVDMVRCRQAQTRAVRAEMAALERLRATEAARDEARDEATARGRQRWLWAAGGLVAGMMVASVMLLGPM